MYACSVLTRVTGLWAGQHGAHPTASSVSLVLTSMIGKGKVTGKVMVSHPLFAMYCCSYFPPEAPSLGFALYN